MKVPVDIKRQIIVLVVSLVTSIIFGFSPSWTGVQLTTSEQLIFTVVLFIAFLLLDITWLLSGIFIHHQKEEDLWLLREACDTELSDIRASFYHIARESYGNKDLFITYFIKKFQKLSNDIKEVAEKKELHVQADHFLYLENVLDAFHRDDERIWRYTWPISSDETLFEDLHWRRYFERTTDMALQRQIKEIRAILIIENPHMRELPRFKKLLDFFHTNSGMKCSIILKDKFNVILRGNGIVCNFMDFGIYGNTLLYLGEKYEPEIIGTFSKDPVLIQNYKKLFDSIWESPNLSKINPSTAKTQVTLEELFKFDETA